MSTLELSLASFAAYVGAVAARGAVFIRRAMADEQREVARWTSPTRRRRPRAG